MSLMLIVALVTSVLAVVAAVTAIVMAPTTTTGVARSLEVIEEMRRPTGIPLQDLPAKQRLLDPLLALGLRLARRLTPTGAELSLQRRLDLAGNPGTWTPERILATKGCGVAAGLLLGGLMLAHAGMPFGLLWPVCLTAAGFWLPDLLLYNAALHRQQQLAKTTPDALDMLTVCVEAGLGFDAALSQVARKVTGPIAGECARILQEMQIGKSRTDAFRALAERTTVPELKTFVAALVQADKLGIPVGNVLREQSREMRVKRRQRAEEQAQKVPIKILFPMLFCIFPAIFVVIIGPGAISIVETFSGR